MATTIVKTIGTGGDYSTLQAWEDACPANLVTADQVWQGQLKNQEFSAAGLQLTISGTTVDATRYVELTTAPGASFADHANKATNALRYNASNGAAIKMTGAYANAVSVTQAYTRISKIQFAGTDTGSGVSAALIVNLAGTSNCDINQCIFEASTSSGSQGCVDLNGDGNVLRNSLIIQTRNNVASLIATFSGASLVAVNNTFVSTQAVLTAGIKAIYGTTALKNCYVGNVVAPLSGGQTPTKTNCYCSATATGFSTAAFSTSTFENITHGTHDFRLKAGSALIDVGTTDSTNAANDITGLARSGSWDVGAWESAAAGSSSSFSAASGSTFTGTATSSATSSATSTFSVSSGSTFSGSASVTATGVITTPVLKNNTGTVLASETGVIVNIYHATTGALIVQKTGQTSNGSGVVTVSDALIIPATTYAYEVILTGSRRRLPTVSAT